MTCQRMDMRYTSIRIIYYYIQLRASLADAKPRTLTTAQKLALFMIFPHATREGRWLSSRRRDFRDGCGLAVEKRMIIVITIVTLC